MSFNADLIRARCAEIQESVARLEEFQALSLEAFLENRDALDVASYRLLVAIEAALALCYHVSAKSLHKSQRSMRHVLGCSTKLDSFLNLSRNACSKWLA